MYLQPCVHSFFYALTVSKVVRQLVLKPKLTVTVDLQIIFCKAYKTDQSSQLAKLSQFLELRRVIFLATKIHSHFYLNCLLIYCMDALQQPKQHHMLAMSWSAFLTSLLMVVHVLDFVQLKYVLISTLKMKCF